MADAGVPGPARTITSFVPTFKFSTGMSFLGAQPAGVLKMHSLDHRFHFAAIARIG